MPVLLALVLVACQKTEYIDAPPQLQFTVVNEEGTLVDSAKVMLYSTYEDWYSVQNPLDSAFTDTTGRCLFTDLQEVYYFFDVSKGEDLLSMMSTSSTKGPLKMGVLTNITLILKKEQYD